MLVVLLLASSCTHGRRGSGSEPDAAGFDAASFDGGTVDAQRRVDAATADARLPDAMRRESGAADASFDAEVDASLDDGTLWLFVTRQTYTGNLGGLVGADALCQQAADEVGLTGTFRAFLSDGSTNARQRLPAGGPWRARTGARVFADVFSWDEFPETDRYGFDASGFSNNVDYWTGTFLGGTKSSATCESWTNMSDARGQFGSPATDDWWVERSTSACSSEKSLLCFERP